MYAFSRNIETLPETDVLVVGSGSAGSIAAITAAQIAGARGFDLKVTLLERYGFLGGTSTAVLDTFYGFYTPGKLAKRVVSGVADQVLQELETVDNPISRPNTFGAGTGITYNPEMLKVVWERLAAAANVDVRMHSFVADLVMSGDRIDGVVVASKAGLGVLRAKVFIDASGDADVAARAGAPFEMAGEIEPAQTLTTTFRIANVDTVRARQVPRSEFADRMRASAESGAYDLPRRDGSVHITPVEGVMATILTRTSVKDPIDPVQLTGAEIEGRRQALEYERFLRGCIPGYERAKIVAFSTQSGIRETRRIYGAYRLTREDVLSARSFPDAVGLCGAPIEDHHAGHTTKWQYLPEGQAVSVPYRTLLPMKVSNLLVAGRCFSATHNAHASVRSMAQCMMMGQAAGTAAVLASRLHTTPHEVPYPELRDLLLEKGATLTTPEHAEEPGTADSYAKVAQ